MLRAFAILFVALLIGAWPLSAEIRRVPADYPTIQSALDNVVLGDTVEVALGVYPEALIAPATMFWLIGNVETDTGFYSRPVIDPTIGPDSLTSGCLFAPAGSDVRIERLHFRNRNNVVGRAPFGGVSTHAAYISLVHCLFDSTYWGVGVHDDTVGTVELQSCVFRDCITPFAQALSGTVIADSCQFFGETWVFIRASSGTRVTNCSFHGGETHGVLLEVYGFNIEISSNAFLGPTHITGMNVIDLAIFSGLFADNLIADFSYISPAIYVRADCLRNAQISGNVFHNLRRATPGGGLVPPLLVKCWEDTGQVFFDVASNTFTACSTASLSKALYFEGNARVFANRFLFNPPPTRPAVIGSHAPGNEVHRNLFFQNGIAVQAQQCTLNAQWNWWGDSTGPFHPDLNPNGQGDEVGDDIIFDPWYPDTSFLRTSPRSPFIPREFTLSAYPNPFNSDCRFQIHTPNPGMYSIDLYDALGRRAAHVWNGAVGYEREVRFDASRFPSGIYFARLSESFINRPLATSKLVLMK